MNAMETMIRTIIKAMGLNPEALMQQMSDFMEAVSGTLRRVDATMTRIETRVMEANEKLDRITPANVRAKSFAEDMNPIVIPMIIGDVNSEDKAA